MQNSYWPVHTKNILESTSDGHWMAIRWTFYRMGSVPNFFQWMEAIFFKFNKCLYI